MPTCEECGGEVTYDYDTGEYVCQQCGLVAAEVLSLSYKREYRIFTPDQVDRVRHGAGRTPLLHDYGLSTTMQYRDAKRDPELLRLIKLNNRTRLADAKDRNLSNALSDISRVGDQIGIKDPVLKYAAQLYRKVLDKDLVRGRTITGMALACLYFACRVKKAPFSIKTIAETSGIPKNELARLYRFLFNELDEEVPIPDVIQYVDTFGRKLKLKEPTIRLAAKIVEEAKERRLVVGRGPHGLAGASLYLAASHSDKDKRTQAEVARTCEVTEVTIRNRYKELVSVLEYLEQ
jgi:transcription initiation factor TFIIB